MRQRGAVLIALVTACGVDLPLRDDVTYTCRTSADCPLELSCAVAIQSCVADLDTIAPRLTSITTSNRQTVILVFDEAVDHDLAALPSTFIIVRDDGQPLEVLAAAPLEDGKSIVLRTGTQRGAAVYTLETSITDAQGNLATLDQETFTGFGSAPDSTPPQTIAPVDASVMVVPPPDRDDLTVILAWTPRSGAINYTVEVSSKATFDPIDMTIEVRGDESSQVLRVVEGTTYFWRVRSDATVPGEFGSASFTILFDTVYVYCPVGTACRAGDGVGSKNVPLASVARAITLATDRALPTIAVAARGNDAGGNVATYDEPISITGAGRTIVGGYDGSFAGPPNRAINRARIAYELGVLTVTQNTGVITIDKLELEATLTNEVAPPTQELVTATMSELGADVVFRDCLITTADTNDGGTPETTLPAATLALAAVNIGTAAVRLDAATTVTAGRAFRSTTAALSLNGHLVVEGSHLTARRVFDSNAGASSVGLAAVGGIVEVVDALIEAGNFVPTIGFPSGAVNVLNTAGAIRRSTIVSGDGGARGNGVVVLGLTNDLLELTGNTVVVTSAIENGTGIIWQEMASTLANNVVVVDSPTSARGIHVVGLEIHRVVNNTIVVSGAGDSTGFYVSTGAPDLANNLVVCSSGAGASSGVTESLQQSDPRALINNVFIGCDTAYQQDDGALVANANSVDGEPMDCGGCTQVRSSGNVSMASFDPFVSAGGADGNLDTPDGDFTLATTDVAITEGGVDTASTSCGNTGQLHDCGALTVDFAGRARTLPTSIGAHEKD